MTVDNGVDPTINREHRRRRPLDGNIGFVGLGRMGSAMAPNLAAGGCRVIGYIRRSDRAAEIRALGVEPKFGIADLFDCDFVINMLPDDPAVRDAVFGKPGEVGFAAGLKPNAVHLSMSTISTAAAGEFAEEHEKRGDIGNAWRGARSGAQAQPRSGRGSQHSDFDDVRQPDP